MKIYNLIRPAARAAGLAWLVWLGLGGGVATAGHVSVFTLDVPNSILTVSGLLSFGNTTLPVKSQAPGSLLTTLSGNLVADIMPGVSIELLGGASVVPVQQPGGFLPGGLAADMAGRVLNILPGVNAYGAFRNDILEFASLGAMPLAANAFDASATVTNFTAGQFDYDVAGILTNSYSIANTSLANDAGLTGQLNVVGTNYQLILPIQTTLQLSGDGFDLILDIEGRVVAYGPIPVPEPSTLALACLGGALLMGVRRRRR